MPSDKIVYFSCSLISKFSVLVVIVFLSYFFKDNYKEISTILIFSYVGAEFINNWLSFYLPRELSKGVERRDVLIIYISTVLISSLVSIFTLKYAFSLYYGVVSIFFVLLGSGGQLASLFLISINKIKLGSIFLLFSAFLKVLVLLFVYFDNDNEFFILCLYFILSFCCLFLIFSKVNIRNFFLGGKYFLLVAVVGVFEIRFESFLYITYVSDKYYLIMDHILKLFMVFSSVVSIYVQHINVKYYYEGHEDGNMMRNINFIYQFFFWFFMIFIVCLNEYYEISYLETFLIYISMSIVALINVNLTSINMRLIRANKEVFNLFLQFFLILIKCSVLLIGLRDLSLVFYLSFLCALIYIVWGFVIYKRIEL